MAALKQNGGKSLQWQNKSPTYTACASRAPLWWLSANQCSQFNCSYVERSSYKDKNRMSFTTLTHGWIKTDSRKTAMIFERMQYEESGESEANVSALLLVFRWLQYIEHLWWIQPLQQHVITQRVTPETTTAASSRTASSLQQFSSYRKLN